jgi:hypothetical protein
MKGVTVARPHSPSCREMIEAYRLTDAISGAPYCKVRLETATRWARQDLVRWCKDGKAIQLTEAVAEPSVAGSSITAAECEANAGAADEDRRIAAARHKVVAWLLVGADPNYCKPTSAPLPTEPGGIKNISREELERLSSWTSWTGLAIVGEGTQPVDEVLRKNRTRLPTHEFVQHYEDDERESTSDVPIGFHEVTDELET